MKLLCTLILSLILAVNGTDPKGKKGGKGTDTTTEIPANSTATTDSDYIAIEFDGYQNSGLKKKLLKNLDKFRGNAPDYETYLRLKMNLKKRKRILNDII